MACRLIPLGSGSGGNATLVEFGPTRILVDAGLSARDLGGRLTAMGVDPDSVDLILLTHEHYDHVRGAERYSKLHKVPVAARADTLAAMAVSPMHFREWIPLTSGTEHDFDGVRVTPFPVPHDAADPVGFILEGCGVRAGIATDLGRPTALVAERRRGCQAILIETNHDKEMLRTGPYPWQLKQRVSSRLGHLSNEEAAALVAMAADEECRAVCLLHLSRKNNTRKLAFETVRNSLDRGLADRMVWRIADQKQPCDPVLL